MERYIPRIFVISVSLIIAFSVLATAYATFIIQEFDIYGVFDLWIEDDTVFVEYYSESELHEATSTVLETEAIIEAMSLELDMELENVEELYYDAVEDALMYALEDSVELE